MWVQERITRERQDEVEETETENETDGDGDGDTDGREDVRHDCAVRTQ